MAPVLVVRNDPIETFGLALRAMRAADLDLRVIDAWDEGAWPPDLSGISGIVMLGGSMNVDRAEEHPFLLRDRATAAEAVERGIPYLGICLGAQILARALGKPVMPGPVRELGFEPLHPTEDGVHDALLAAYEDGEMVFHWHEDTLELPDEAVLLATGDRIRVQAYRVGDRAWGVQFHLEVDAAEVGFWLEEASVAGDVEAHWGKSPDAVRREAKRFIDRHERLGRGVFERFATVVCGARD